MNKIIYHANCNDGFAAAMVVRKWLQENLQDTGGEEYIPAHYGDEAPDVTGHDVWIVDFSYPRDTLLKMHDQADSLKVIDHHKTAEADLADLDFCIFDQNHCGAMLTWLTLFPDAEPPRFLHYIEDRDLWKWEMECSKEFHAGLASWPRDFEHWTRFLTDDPAQLIYQGSHILRYQQRIIDGMMSKPHQNIVLLNFTVPVINTDHLISEKLNELCKGHPFAVAYFDTEDKRVYSLRSDENGFDVSYVAKYYGGGGHKHAAGFTLHRFRFLSLMERALLTNLAKRQAEAGCENSKGEEV